MWLRFLLTKADKISTKDIGIIRIIDGTKEQYRSDGHEKAKLLFRRYGRK